MELLPETSTDLLPLGVSLAIGLILGFERGWHPDQEDEAVEGTRPAGIRTFALTGLLGGVLAHLVRAGASAALLPTGLITLGALLTATYLVGQRRSGDVGSTTESALLLAFVLGALPPFGHAQAAVATAVVAAALLGFKTRIHETLLLLDRREMQAALQLLLIALVLLPMLPDRSMGPWEAINPRMIGLLVLLIAGIGFVGYLAMRHAPARSGLLLTALLGGVVSSTAATVAFARMARRAPERSALLGAAVALACGAMAPRMLLAISFVGPSVALRLVPAVLVLATVPVLAGLWLARGRARDVTGTPLRFDNPLELRQALVIAVVLTAVFVLAHGAEALLGARGVYGFAVLAGVGDVDAVALSLTRQAGASLEPAVAARAILLAALTNTLAKAGLAAVIGGAALARTGGAALLLTLLTGAAALPFL